MSHQIWFIPGLPSVTEYIYLSDGRAQTPWNGSSTPWTSAATTPFALAMNETAGTKWTPQASVPMVQYEGGPPFSDGQRPRVVAYPNVTEQMTIQIYVSGSSANQKYVRAVYLKNMLYRALNTALYQSPALLNINMESSGTQMRMIYRAEMQEDARFLNDENDRGFMRVVVTLTLAPFATATNPLTDISAVTFTSNGATSSSYALAPKGERIYEGQPMNVTLSGGVLATSGVKNVWLAVAKDIRRVSPGTALSTSSTSAVNAGSAITTNVYPDSGVKTRITARVASPTSTLRVRAVALWPAATGTTFFVGEWVAPGSTSGAFFDLGEIDFPPQVRLAAVGLGGTIQISVLIQYKSTGGTVTGTLTWVGGVDYYTWAKLTSPSVSASTTFYSVGAVSGAGGVAAEAVPPLASAGNQYANNLVVAGELPRSFAGARLFVMWDDAGAQSDSNTISVTAQYLAQYRTLMGDATMSVGTL